MAAEIEALKARAGGRWTEPDSAAPAPSAERATVAPARLSVAPPAALSPPAPLTPRPAPRSEEIPFPQAQAAASPPHKPYTFWRRTSPSSSYRTLCVRLCDGFYYPVSYATRPGSFADEDKQCQSTCSAPAKLFYHANPGEAVEQMVALTGERYGELPNAFRYRTEYVENCRCRPAPWSAEAKAEFDKRAVVAEQTEAERIVSAGATEAARIMAGGNVEIAENAPAGGRSPYYNRGASYGQGAYRPPLFARFRTPRYSYGTSPASAVAATVAAAAAWGRFSNVRPALVASARDDGSAIGITRSLCCVASRAIEAPSPSFRHDQAPPPLCLPRQYLPFPHGRRRVPSRRRGARRARPLRDRLSGARRTGMSRASAGHARASGAPHPRHRYFGPKRKTGQLRVRILKRALRPLIVAMDRSNYDELQRLAPRSARAVGAPVPRFLAPHVETEDVPDLFLAGPKAFSAMRST